MDVGTDTEYPREGPTADVADLLHSEHVSYSKKKNQHRRTNPTKKLLTNMP